MTFPPELAELDVMLLAAVVVTDGVVAACVEAVILKLSIPIPWLKDPVVLKSHFK